MPEPTTVPDNSSRLTGGQILVIVLSALTGVCYGVLAGLSISAMAEPVRRFQYFSVVIAAVSIYVAYQAFRAATSGETDREALAEALFGGMIGAFVGLILVGGYLFLFRPDAEASLAHALGRRASGFTTFRVVIASVLLGFGAGFVVRMRTVRT